ncbi:sodium-extruding oxaloacetate decarboxylase subunit alpha [Salmonella enterica]|nr:sodium-extruding oxaloacetate decarboxylase subunit alpha [Salmonella enterica]
MTISITDVVLRDAHQSLFATRLRLDDMLPIAAALDDVGYGSLECWGGATFDACIRFLGEDPWLRLRELKKAMPKTPLQMLLRGQNLLGYRHYADDVVERFVERAVKNGMDVFRVFDAMNDPRNMKAALQAVRSHGAHAQGTLSYTTSPAHTLQTWLDLTEQLLETGVDSIAIKDMSGILTPMAAFELVSEIKKRFEVRLHLHCHATTGMAEMALLKAIEAGVDGVDTAISSMSATYGHPATEALVATLAGTEHDTGLDILKLENIAAYFREVRKKYHAFEGQLKGYDSRILVAQVPGGMLTNLESQLKQQNAADKLDQVLAEIPRVREDLGFIPLVTPTSQIVGTQAVLNVLTGERYKTIAKETAGILKGEYGHTPVPVNAALQARVLEGGAPVTCRPADLLRPELAELEADVRRQAQEKGITLAGNAIDDVLTVALFPQIGLKFLENRHNPAAFEPVPQAEAAQPAAAPAKAAASGIYTVEVEGKAFVVKVSDGGDISQLTTAVPAASSAPVQAAAPAGAGTPVTAPLAGNIWKVIAAKLNCTPDVHAIKEALALALPSVQSQMENLAVDMGYTPGVLALFYKVAIGSGVAPLVIFMGVGAMTDFGPLLANPRTLLLGAAAQFGIFATVLGALTLNYFGLIAFTLPQAAAIGIIGGADGPTAIYLSGKLAPELLGAIAVAAYSYMALVPLIQPPIMKALTTETERKIRMVQLRTVSKREKILFPVVLLLLVALLLPDAAPLLGMFCFGNLMRESGVVERLSDTVQNGLINIVTIFLGLSVGAKLVADKFLQPQTLGILLLGVVAFGIGTAAGVLMAKLLNLCSKNKINPLIGSAGVSAVPMAARVSNKVGLESDPQNFLLMHAMGPNVAGVIGSAIAAGVMLKYVLAM